MTPPSSGRSAGIYVLVAARPDFDRLPAAHVFHSQRRHDRLQALGVHQVVVELRPASLASRHEVPAIEVEHQRARPRLPRQAIEVSHDPEHAEAAILLDQRHGVGVRREQNLLVLRRAVVLARKIRDEGPADVTLEAGGQSQRGRLAGLGVRQHLRPVHAIEREGRTIDICCSEAGFSVRRVDASLGQTERRARRQVVNHHDACRPPGNADRRKPVQLTPDPAAMVGTGDARRRRDEQRRPLAR